MTQNMASGHSFPTSAASRVSLQGIEHGYVERPAARKPTRRKSLALWKWVPRDILRRGGTATRDDERAYRDIQAVRDRSEDGMEERGHRF
jgi:hypothetical protein